MPTDANGNYFTIEKDPIAGSIRYVFTEYEDAKDERGNTVRIRSRVTRIRESDLDTEKVALSERLAKCNLKLAEIDKIK